MTTSIPQILRDELFQFRQCVPLASGFKGNIGVFRYVLKDSKPINENTACKTNEVSILGEGVFGASFLVYQEIRDQLRSSFKEGCTIVTNAVSGCDENGEATDYKIYTHEIKPVEGENAQIILEFFSPRPKRRYDSEYLLTNFLQNEIWNKDLRSGTFHLLTELPPCESCSNVLYEFLNTNSDSDVHIYYLKDPNKSSADFDFLKNTNRAKFTQLV
jgi:hypothetical protein